MPEQKAPRNRTITLTDAERQRYFAQTVTLAEPAVLQQVTDKTIFGEIQQAAPLLPRESVDLLFLDPPYNLNRTFGERSFYQTSLQEYSKWFESWFVLLVPLLKPSASVYVCSDWLTSCSVFEVVSRHLIVRNRITWEREKGRGAQKNWKNSCEDIWFCTVSDTYPFYVDRVMLKRKVLAPYRRRDGLPKDWSETDEGNFRLTHPSNFWTDLTVPFWSMPENTDHPTQKPEKLLAKLILASTDKGDVVLDPFCGSGTTSVAAKKLGRHYIGIEREAEYCCLAEKRLELAETDKSIQGYEDGVFWERNAKK